MGMYGYKAARWRFTWKNRTIPRGDSRVLVLGPCKDQKQDAVRGIRGRCRYYCLAKVLEDHIRLHFNIDVEISIDDLERDVKSFDDDKHKDNVVWLTCDFLKKTGAVGLVLEGNLREVRFKLEAYRPIKVEDFTAVRWAIGRFMLEGPMVGVFPIHGDDMEKYAESKPDEIYFVSKEKPKTATHCVALPGFGFVSKYPFWHFENSYSTSWRGPARGFGQLYAPHLQELYGVKLEGGREI